MTSSKQRQRQALDRGFRRPVWEEAGHNHLDPLVLYNLNVDHGSFIQEFKCRLSVKPPQHFLSVYDLVFPKSEAI